VPDGFSLTKQELEDQAQSRRQGSNSEEDDLTPAQSRRKAQNRAAYVAIRLLHKPPPHCVCLPGPG